MRPCPANRIAAHRACLMGVASTVSDVPVDEMVRLHMAPLNRDASAAQIRVAQAQLLGWLQVLVDEDERG